MSKLANRNATRKVIAALKRAGFKVEQGKRHTIVFHPDGRYSTVPQHPRVKPNLLRTILKQLKITEDEFVKHYR